MKYEKKKNNKLLIWILVIEVILILVLLAALLLIKPASQEAALPSASTAPETTPATTEDSAAPTETEAVVTQPVETEPAQRIDSTGGVIETPYLTLNYPEALSDHLVVATVSSDPYTLGFFASLEGKPDQRLFDVSLIPNAEGNLGAVQTDSGSVGVSMTIYRFEPDSSWTQGQINTVLAMQEAANEITNQLNVVVDESASVVSEASSQQNTANYLEIETPYCIVEYPAVWSSYLTVDQTEQDNVLRVLFYGQPEGAEKQLLFSILFGGDEGSQLGIVTSQEGVTVPVNLLMAELETDGLTADQEELLYSMQDEVNHLISRLPLN